MSERVAGSRRRRAARKRVANGGNCRRPGRAAILVAAAIFAMACDAQTGAEPASIAPQELAESVRRGDAPLILDVRSEAEYRAAHIPGAVNIPHDQLRDRLAEIDAAKRDEIVVHCKSGRRAGIAEQILGEAGYSNLRDLEGHMDAWQSGGYPTEGS